MPVFGFRVTYPSGSSDFAVSTGKTEDEAMDSLRGCVSLETYVEPYDLEEMIDGQYLGSAFLTTEGAE